MWQREVRGAFTVDDFGCNLCYVYIISAMRDIFLGI